MEQTKLNQLSRVLKLVNINADLPTLDIIFQTSELLEDMNNDITLGMMDELVNKVLANYKQS